MTYPSNGIVLHSPAVGPTGDVWREWYIVTDPLHGYLVTRDKALDYIKREGLVEALDCKDGTVYDKPGETFYKRYKGFVAKNYAKFKQRWDQI